MFVINKDKEIIFCKPYKGDYIKYFSFRRFSGKQMVAEYCTELTFRQVLNYIFRGK